MDVKDAVKIEAARQIYDTGKAHHETKYLAGDLEEISGLRKLKGLTATFLDDEAAT